MLQVDQDKARVMGIDAQNFARNLNAVLDDLPITQYREGDHTIDVLLRTRQDEPDNLQSFKDLYIYNAMFDFFEGR